MPELESIKLIPQKMTRLSSEAEHHKIAAKLKAMSDGWDRREEKTGKRPKEAFDYSFGLIMGKELIFATLSKDGDTLKQKILVEAEVVKWQ